MIYITLALQLLPLLLKCILAVEDMLKDSPGLTKKAIVLTALDQSVASSEPGKPVDISQQVVVASKLVDSIVGVLNKTIWAGPAK